MNQGGCWIEVLTGQTKNNYRAVAFLICPSNSRVNAKNRFETLFSASERTLRDRFDHWINGGHSPKWHHGWDQSQYNGAYKKCYVFKYLVERIDQRMYGFLCNPDERNKRFQLCVLVLHSTKTAWETEESDLKQTKDIGESSTVKLALAKLFKPANGGRR